LLRSLPLRITRPRDLLPVDLELPTLGSWSRPVPSIYGVDRAIRVVARRCSHPFEPNQWTIANYQTVLATDGMGDAFINSLIVTIPSVAIPITIAAFAAYAFAWVPFRGRGILFTIVVALLVVPIQMSLIPILKIYAAGNLYGSFLGIWLAHTGFGLPLAIFLLYNFMSQLPRDLFESAAMDGASALQVFIRLVLPLSIPAIGAITIFQFLWVWNDLLVALVFLGPGQDVRVLPTALYQLIGSRGGSWHLLTAGAFITMVVPLIVFLLLQRAFVRGSWPAPSSPDRASRRRARGTLRAGDEPLIPARAVLRCAPLVS
jgi:alpha-glucoside transport system permease protein